MRRFEAPRRALAAVFAAATLLVITAASAVAADRTVTVQGFAFGPASVTVNVGDTLTWTNQDPAPHTATATNGAFDVELAEGGGSGSATMRTAGTFPYFCEIHPNMRGTVVVRAAARAGGAPAGGQTGGQAGGGQAGGGQPDTDTAPLGGGETPATALPLLLALVGLGGLAAAGAVSRYSRGS